MKNRPGAGRPRSLDRRADGRTVGDRRNDRPDPEIDGVVRWRRVDLKRVIEDHALPASVIYSERGDLSRPSRRGSSFSHISARPQSPQDVRVAGDRGVQKNWIPRTLAAHLAGLPKTASGSRSGSKTRPISWDRRTGRVRIWAKKGTRPRLPADRALHDDAYLFGAICPMGAKGAALMLPFVQHSRRRRRCIFR